MHDAFAERCLAEVQALHRFFQQWFRGELPDTLQAFARFADGMSADFSIISPSGKLLTREPLLAALRARHGALPDSRIWIEHARFRPIGHDYGLVIYEEWQRSQSQTSARLSSALFADDPQAPGGVRWLHVHETWLPSQTPATNPKRHT